MLKIPKVFYADRRSAGATLDPAITRLGKRMLRRVAHDLRLRADEHEIVAEPARCGRGCRVTLHTSSLMFQVAGSPAQGVLALSFRTRRGRTDLSGGGDNAVPFEQFASRAGYDELLGGLRLAAGLDGERR